MAINWQSPINSFGYGYTGAYLLNEISKLTDVTLFEIGRIDKLGKLSDRAIELSFTQNNYPINKNAISLRLWHQNEVHYRIGKGKHYGFPIFELDTFRDQEINSINSCDHLIVSSEWAKSITEQNGTNIPIDVVPLGYDPNIFKFVNKINSGPTVFFNCGKWEKRKGHDFILECFETAFTYSDNVELWMMCHNPFEFAKGEEWEEMYKNSKMYDKIRLIPRQNSHKNVYNIMSRVDCGVFPARAEGWNLELLELMACGKQLIATDYSGHTEFAKNGVRLIPIDRLEPAIDNIWFHGQGNWAHLGKEQKELTIQHMRDIHKDKQNNSLKPNNEAAIAAQEFTWAKSAHKLLKVVTNDRYI